MSLVLATFAGGDCRTDRVRPWFDSGLTPEAGGLNCYATSYPYVVILNLYNKKKLSLSDVYLTLLKIPTSTTHKRQFTAAAYNDFFQC